MVFPVFLRNIPYRPRPKGPPFNFFSPLRDFFFEQFFPQRVPLQFFLLFCVRVDVEKSQRVPPFSFSALWDFFLKIFLSKGSPLQFLWYFTTDWVFTNPKGSPLSVFRHCETFFRFFFSKRSPFNKNVDNFESVILLASQGLALAGPDAPLGPFFCFFDFRVL